LTAVAPRPAGEVDRHAADLKVELRAESTAARRRARRRARAVRRERERAAADALHKNPARDAPASCHRLRRRGRSFRHFSALSRNFAPHVQSKGSARGGATATIIAYDHEAWRDVDKPNESCRAGTPPARARARLAGHRHPRARAAVAPWHV
jgi:hypothetical protein